MDLADEVALIANLIKEKKAFTINISHQIVGVKPKNNIDFELEEMYQLLDTHTIEIVRRSILPYDYIMIVDEIGLVRNDKAPMLNKIATWLYGGKDQGAWAFNEMPNNHPIVNTVLVCPTEMVT